MPAHNGGGGLELRCVGGVDDQQDPAIEDLTLSLLVDVGFVALPEQGGQPAHATTGGQRSQQRRRGRSTRRSLCRNN